MTPTPKAVFAARKPQPPATTDLPVLPESRLLAVTIDPSAHGKRVRPGTVTEEFFVHHDGVLKTKNLAVGQVVRPWLHGEPKGCKRTVAKVTRMEDGAMLEIEWTDFPTSQHKAAYRWHCAELVGTLLRQVRQVPAFVEA
jgi:hypothetical protein